ncbi:MAG: ABC transporter ATP-binding protein [unclassified Hahellaceae]|nr:ABC transporter ATP-binding protein [Hahellaceae bacterium]|tara:strand:+ start:42381 stop:43163 length:783 start_codon:yes stop_codon:yes gene_type:complete
MSQRTIIKVSKLVNRFGHQTVHEQLDFEIYAGEIVGLVGGSGTGKTVLLNSILGLQKPSSGTIEFYDVKSRSLGDAERCPTSWGVLFQSGALFSNLTVLENIVTPLIEHTSMSRRTVRELALLRMRMVGLPLTAQFKYPSQLSGGMVKRAALARALVTDPRVIFLDEPTSGLDPIAAEEFDELILYLKQHLDLTVVMISHDLDSLFNTCDRIAVLVDKKIRAATPAEIVENDHPWIQRYFGGRRGRLHSQGSEAHTVHGA